MNLVVLHSDPSVAHTLAESLPPLRHTVLAVLTSAGELPRLFKRHEVDLVICGGDYCGEFSERLFRNRHRCGFTVVPVPGTLTGASLLEWVHAGVANSLSAETYRRRGDYEEQP